MRILEDKKTRNYKPLIWILTTAIISLITVAFSIPKLAILKGHNFSYLPLVNAVLNSITFIFLALAFIAIRQKNIQRHRNFIFSAFTATTLFLVCYLLYHYSTPSTKYGGDGPLRYIYFFLLITHIILAVVIVPLALITIGRGLNMEVPLHKKIARWTMPIWMYVSLTGVIVYLLISPYYK
jgi:putative membrane protein